jgi:hypothetical protein
MKQSLKLHPTSKSSTPLYGQQTTLPQRVSRRAIHDRRRGEQAEYTEIKTKALAGTPTERKPGLPGVAPVWVSRVRVLLLSFNKK